MIRVISTSGFLRDYKKLPEGLQKEAKERIVLFKENPRMPTLRFHKLHGGLKGYWSFSVNYKFRVVVEEDAKDIFALLAVGDHDVYE